VPFAECREHTVENITLLCRFHHGEVTAGRISKERVIEANENPYGKRQDRSAAYEYETLPIDEVDLFGVSKKVTHSDKEIIVARVFGESVFSIRFQDRRPLFSISVKDFNSSEILKIEENEIYFQEEDLTDIDFVGTLLTIKSNDLSFEAKIRYKENRVSFEFLKFYHSRHLFVYRQSGLEVFSDQGGHTRIARNHVIIPGGVDVFCLIDVYDPSQPSVMEQQVLSAFRIPAKNTKGSSVSQGILDIANEFQAPSTKEISRKPDPAMEAMKEWAMNLVKDRDRIERGHVSFRRFMNKWLIEQFSVSHPVKAILRTTSTLAWRLR